MTARDTLQLGSVPEHFFYPWKKWLEENSNQKFGFQWNWTDYPGGSGAMLQALQSKEIDFAFLLTESAAFAAKTDPSIKVLSVFVKSPLHWGVFTGINNALTSVTPVQEKTYAISRFGSGSHLMAKVDAHQRGETIREDKWMVVNNLAGAVEALTSGEADLFFWEKWMTKPLVDKGVFKMVDVCPSPWPSFVLVGRSEAVENVSKMRAIRMAFSEVIEWANDLKTRATGSGEIAEGYHLNPKDAQDWLAQVEWVSEWTNPEADLKKAGDFLRKSEG